MTQEQKQDFFNRAVAGLASQGFARSQSEGMCKYRGPDGKRCALGHLIADEVYQKNWDLTGSLVKPLEAVLGFAPGPHDARFFDQLQQAHDNSYGYDDAGLKVDRPETMKSNLRVFAEENELTIPEVLK